MLIHHAILGLLSYRSFTGYELKKRMQDSSFMYWSGNNNQIYKGLMNLQNEGLVTCERYDQTDAPPKKVYTITEEGWSALKRWSQGAPELPEIKMPFLVQLAWSGQLSGGELEQLLKQYEEEVKGRLLLEQGKGQKSVLAPDRTPRETAIWNLIQGRVTRVYQDELDWIRQVREGIQPLGGAEVERRSEMGAAGTADEGEENVAMTYQAVVKKNQTYIFVGAEGKQIQTEQDGLDLISVCAEHGAKRLLISGEALSDAFFQLRTGVAGAIVQKFATYGMKAVVVLPEDQVKGRLKDFLAESNRGGIFRAYPNFVEAEAWLLSE